MKKSIEMSFLDGSMHKVIVTQADVTNDDRIVISYYDFSDGVHASFSELVKVGEKYYRNPNVHEWKDYVHKFKPFDRGLSDRIVESLPEKIGLYDSNVEYDNPVVLGEVPNIGDLEDKPIVKPGKVNYIMAVLYANNGGTVVKYDGTNPSPIFFALPEITKDDPMKEVYKSIEIDEDDTKELVRYIEARLGDESDISLISPNRRFEVSSGNKFAVTFVSCDERPLFYEVAASDKLAVDMSVSSAYGYYSDPLSLALHHELPLELTINGKTLRYEVNSNVGHKKVV